MAFGVNVRGIVRQAVASINPDITATILQSDGYTTGSDYKQVPKYKTITGVTIQVQGSMNAQELAQVNNLNIQGVKQAVYIPGNWQGVVRADKKGGDVLQFADTDGLVKNWLIVHILESWPEFTKVIVTLQV